MVVAGTLKRCINDRTVRNVSKFLISIALTVHSIQTVFGALLFQRVDDLPRGVDYDFIITGGKENFGFK